MAVHHRGDGFPTSNSEKQCGIPMDGAVFSTLHKTSDIPAEAKEADAASPSPMGPPYIFCYHPHGVISVGWNLGLNTNAAGFDELFPGLQNRFGVTLSQSFCFPLFREYMRALGFISCKKQVMVHRLLAGDSLALVPGGAPEALHAHAGVSRLTLRSRFGFLKLAQQHQVSVVPCFAFGENNAFHTYYGYVPDIAVLRRHGP
jgi:Diacylglycerol acyltransferase